MSSTFSASNSPPFSPSPSPVRSSRKLTPKKRSSSHVNKTSTRTISATPSSRKRGKSSNSQEVKQEESEKGGRKTGSWTKREVRELFDAVIVIPSSVSWTQVADKVEGRDKLSCSNKWRYDLLPKIQTYIDSLGE